MTHPILTPGRYYEVRADNRGWRKLYLRDITSAGDANFSSGLSLQDYVLVVAHEIPIYVRECVQ